MNWEKNAIEQLRPSGDVLEIGYSSAAAKEIEKFHPRTLTILSRAVRNPPKIAVIKEEGLAELGVFDAIFCHDHFGFSEPFDEMMPELFKMRYNETELDSFCKSASAASKSHVSRFLWELQEREQIEPGLREKMMEKYDLPEPARKGKTSAILPLALECIQHHMRKGSLFCCSSSIADEKGYIEKIIGNPALDVREENGFLIIEKSI